MSPMFSSLEEFIDLLCDKIDLLTAHSFIAKSQSAYLKQQKEELQEDSAIVICDFAENFQYVIQDEVQSYHWSKQYCTLHPISLYHKSDSGVQTESLCVLSDDIKHDTPFVHKCLELTADHIKAKYPHIKKIQYFTDGCGGQYKNYKNFMNVCEHLSDFGISATWNFFGTSHGKGPCDGIGGTVKRLAYLESLRRTNTNYIISIDKMFEFCSTIKNIQFHLVKSADMDAVRERQERRYERGSTLPGTQSFHQFLPIDSNTVAYKRISSDDFIIGKYSFGIKQPAIHDIRVGNYVAALYDDDWYVGLVEELDLEKRECMINFMHPKMPTGYVNWPPRADRCLTPASRILTVIDVPSSTSIASRTYRVKKEEHTRITKLFSDFIHKQ